MILKTDVDFDLHIVAVKKGASNPLVWEDLMGFCCMGDARYIAETLIAEPERARKQLLEMAVRAVISKWLRDWDAEKAYQAALQPKEPTE